MAGYAEDEGPGPPTVINSADRTGREYNYEVMESFKKQADLGAIDKEMLATAGRRVERWDILKDTSLSFHARKEKVIDDLYSDIRYVEEEETDDPDLQADELKSLRKDLILVDRLLDDEASFSFLCDEQKKFYGKVREAYLAAMQVK